MTDLLQNQGPKRPKLTADQLYIIYQECSMPGAPVKTILDRHGLKPWHLIALKKRIKEAVLQELSNPARRGKKKAVIPVEEVYQLERELSQTKDALATVGHELSLLKKKTS